VHTGKQNTQQSQAAWSIPNLQDTLAVEYDDQEQVLCGRRELTNIRTSGKQVQLTFFTDDKGAEGGFWLKYKGRLTA
jgi:hypothetical protein